MILLQRLFSEDKDSALALIQSRIDSNTKVCLSDNRINQKWVDEVMTLDATYNDTHRIFGHFTNDILEYVFIVKLYQTKEYIVSMLMGHKNSKADMVDGYNTKSNELIEYSIREMEKAGYYTFYSIIPDHPKWKLYDNNPNRSIKDEYSISIIEHIKAGAPSNYSAITSRPFNIDMIIRKMEKKKC